ncbi:hypothetical protein [Streptomyces sp. MK7]|uniref:hypothetical protein n=1 Tax=Streptomyces sp. MK7 TaxID=3067635 RepID=UPI00292F72F5|nr:hypothetical protein [Streptomyces sp. MK7]
MEAFAAKHAGHPGLPGVSAAFGAMADMSGDGDEQASAVVRGVRPSYFADFRGRRGAAGPVP